MKKFTNTWIKQFLMICDEHVFDQYGRKIWCDWYWLLFMSWLLYYQFSSLSYTLELYLGIDSQGISSSNIVCKGTYLFEVISILIIMFDKNQIQ